MPGDDDIDFDAVMRDQKVQRLGRATAKPRAGVTKAAAPQARKHDQGRTARAQYDGAQRDDAQAARRAKAKAEAERDEAREARAKIEAERDAACEARAKAEAERDAVREAGAKAEAERDALIKERRALQRQLSQSRPPDPVPSQPTLREVLIARGVADEGEAVEVLMEVLGHAPADLLDSVEGLPGLMVALRDRLALVCTQPECQPRLPMAVVHVPRERCESCEGSNTRLAWEALLRACVVAGVTRLVIVGGSPNYRDQLRDMCRGTHLKLDLVPGDRKQGRRRARNDAERVVIWGGTIIAHAASAAYEHLGDRLIRITHRGISGMLRDVARTLAHPPS